MNSLDINVPVKPEGFLVGPCKVGSLIHFILLEKGKYIPDVKVATSEIMPMLSDTVIAICDGKLLLNRI